MKPTAVNSLIQIKAHDKTHLKTPKSHYPPLKIYKCVLEWNFTAGSLNVSLNMYLLCFHFLSSCNKMSNAFALLVRLHGSSFLLQIYSCQTKTWKSVCAHGWTDQQGRASCQNIGYSRQNIELFRWIRHRLYPLHASYASYVVFSILWFDRSTYFKSAQQEADSSDGFLMMKPNFNPETSILQQFFHRLVNR